MYVFSVGFLDTRLIGMVHLGVLVFAIAVSSTSIACPGTTHDHDHEYLKMPSPMPDFLCVRVIDVNDGHYNDSYACI